VGHPIDELNFIPKNSSCFMWAYLDSNPFRIIWERYIPKIKADNFEMILMARSEKLILPISCLKKIKSTTV